MYDALQSDLRESCDDLGNLSNEELGLCAMFGITIIDGVLLVYCSMRYENTLCS